MDFSNFKNIRYRLLNKLIKTLLRSRQRIEDSFEEQRALKEQLDWENLFKENDYFFHTVGQSFKLKLYKDSLLSRLIWKGFEIDEIKFIKQTLKRGDVFIDIGANVGLFSVVASECVGEKGKVISYEPTPNIFNRLKENANLNDYQNIICHNLALSNEVGELRLNISNNGFDAWNSFAENQIILQNSISVPVSTLDQELKDLELNRISMVKIDVEGWEKFVLHGGSDFFQKHSPIVMIEFTEENTFKAGYTVQELYFIMIKWGYSWFRFKNGKLVSEEMKMNYPYDNLIAVKTV